MEKPAVLLARISGQAIRRYSTVDFGRDKVHECLSVVTPNEQARSLVYNLRSELPAGFVAFIGTTRWLGDEQHKGVEIVVGPGRSQFDILRLAKSDACNYGMGTEDIIMRLQKWHEAIGIDIFHAETDTIELTLTGIPGNWKAFAEEVYEFCPDIVDQGLGSLDALEDGMRNYQQILLWWD